MKKIIFLLILFLFFGCANKKIIEPSNPWNKQKENIVILPITVSGFPKENEDTYIKIITDNISVIMFSKLKDKYNVIERININDILNEIDIQNSAITDKNYYTEVGTILNAQKLIIGTIGTDGNLFYLSLKCIDVKTGVTINMADNYIKNKKWLNELLYGKYYNEGISKIITNLTKLTSEKLIKGL